MKKSLLAVLIAAPSAACLAQANRLDQLDVRNDARELRQELRQREPVGLVAESAAAPAATTLLSFGAAYTSGDDQHAWNTPFLASFTFPDTKWKLSISTLGYERDSFPDGRAHGWTDVKFKASYPFKVAQGTALDGVLTGGIAVRAPAHGEVGSTARQDELSLSYLHVQDKWSVTLAAALKHNAGDVPPGVSSYPRYGAVSVGRDLTDTTSLGFVIDRLVIPGRAGISTAGLAYDFPLLPMQLRQWNAELALTKGISDADRSTTIEFDMSHKF